MPALTDRLVAMPADERKDYFCTGDIAEITAMIRETSDGDLQKLIGLQRFREGAIDAILDRFAEFSDADRSIDGVVRFELVRSKKEIAHGTVVLDPETTPDVTISADIVDFVRLVTGQSNAALLYLGGRLQIEGQEMLALTVGTVFTAPGSDHATVDPTSLDPVDVATAVAASSGRHMKAVLEGGFRPVVLQEVLRRFPEFIDADKATGLRLSVGLRVGGRKDGEVDRYVVHVADGACTVETGPPEGQPRDATITMEGADFLRLALGQLHPVRGVLTGALKVEGDRAKALALNAVMVPPQPRQE